MSLELNLYLLTLLQKIIKFTQVGEHGFLVNVYRRTGEVTSRSLWSRYDCHFVGITRHNNWRRYRTKFRYCHGVTRCITRNAHQQWIMSNAAAKSVYITSSFSHVNSEERNFCKYRMTVIGRIFVAQID